MKLRDKINKLLQKSNRSKIFVVSFSVIGALLILVSQAAVNFASLEPEAGTRTGNASIEASSLTSGGSFLKFGQQPYTDMFVSTAGSDSNNGSTEALAVKTITKAVQLAKANNEHTRIRIKSGTYIEQVQVLNTNNLIIEPFGNGDVTVNGAIKEFISGVSGWSQVQSGIYRKDLGRDEYKSDGSNVIYGSDGQQQWTYPDILQLKSRFTVNQLPGVFINNNILLGALGVYVATDTGQPPTAPLYIGGTDPTIEINNSDNIAINGLTNSKLNIVYGSYNIHVKDSDGIRISDVDITGGKSAVAAFDTSNLSITNSNLHGTFGREWDWADVKERPGTKTMENQAVHIKPLNKDVNNIVVDGNDISGYFNGVNMGGTTTYFIDDSVISNNIIHDSIDDGIEIDSQYKNLVIHGNKIYDTYSPFSSTGGQVGPVYVYENLFIAERDISDDFGEVRKGPSFAIKMNNDSSSLVEKNIHFYHNTFYFAGNSGNLRKTVQSTNSSVTKGVSFINNIFHSTQGGILRGTGRAQDTIEWDGNVFYSEVNDPTNYYAWNSHDDATHSFISLSSIISAGAMPSGWQGNLEGNPGFNCIVSTNSSCFRSTANITKPSSLQPIPSAFAESTRLNDRTRIGAFE